MPGTWASSHKKLNIQCDDIIIMNILFMHVHVSSISFFPHFFLLHIPSSFPPSFLHSLIPLFPPHFLTFRHVLLNPVYTNPQSLKPSLARQCLPK